MSDRRGVLVPVAAALLAATLACETAERESTPHFSSEAAATWLRGALREEWDPATIQAPRLRGAMYDRVAPAVVILDTRYGFGSGIVVDDSLTILTADHVIADGWFIDREKGASYVNVYFGELDDGVMQLCAGSARGYVLDADQPNDLALLRVDEMPEGCPSPQPLALAGERPRPEDPCVMVGHPSSATLWSIRTGTVSGLGRSPRDLVKWLVHGFDLPERQLEAFTNRTEIMGTQDIVFTTCGSSYGDSGGPLVNLAGELIGVTCAIPSEIAEQKFTYHVDVHHVRELLDRNRPFAGRSPRIYGPDAYRLLGPWLDLPQSHVIASRTHKNAVPNQFLLDLDGDSPAELVERGDFVMLVDNRQFDAEMAVHHLPDRSIVFYDTDNDGAMDDVLVYEEEARAALRFRLDPAHAWRLADDLNVPWLDPSLLEKSRLKRELARIQKEVRLTTHSRS